MQQQVRNHVPELTALLTIVSLALVFGAVLGALPDALLPRFDSLIGVIPHANAAISLAAIGTILYGVNSIREGHIERHRRAMLASTGLFGLFLVLYLYRVTLVGPTSFPGPGTVEQFVYLPILAVHILLAIVCIPFVFYALLLAGSHPVPELPETNHPRAGKIAATLWLISFSLGFVVYLLLHVLF